MRLLNQTKVSTGNSIKNLLNKSLNESEAFDLSSGVLETNTGELRVFDAGQYGCIDEYAYDYEITNEEVDEICLSVGSNILNETLKEVLPSAKVTVLRMYHPRQYNFSSDEIEFKLEFDPKEIENIMNTVASSEDFEQHLSDLYKSYDGFISFYADNANDFNTQDVRKQIISVIQIALKKAGVDYDRLSEDYRTEVYDRIGSEHNTTDEYEREMNESAIFEEAPVNVDKEAFRQNLYHEILNCLEMYNEANDSDYEDCFAGTEDSYAMETLESNLADVILYDMKVDINDQEKFRKYYDIFFDLIVKNDVEGIKKALGIKGDK